MTWYVFLVQGVLFCYNDNVQQLNIICPFLSYFCIGTNFTLRLLRCESDTLISKLFLFKTKSISRFIHTFCGMTFLEQTKGIRLKHITAVSVIFKLFNDNDGKCNTIKTPITDLNFL